MTKQQQPQPQSTTSSSNNDNNNKFNNTVAYAISLVKCNDKQTSTAGLIDAALVLRHSIHNNSVRNPASGSKYDYHMVAIVHNQAVKCSSVLKKVGFDVRVVEPPVRRERIRGEYLRNTIQREWCCGHGASFNYYYYCISSTINPFLTHSLCLFLFVCLDEFIKWYPYRMTEFPVVVHVDIDFLFLQPMDELYDAIIYSKDTARGRKARESIPMEFPKETAWPDRVDAFITRDWPQVIPGRTPGYQAGFLVARPDPTVWEELTSIVLEGNYSKGFGRDNGWGGMGYGGFVGAMAMQGLMAYYYDVVRRGTAVELNQCRYNWMGMDVRYRANPNFRKNHPKRGQCRNDRKECEDCRATPTSLIKSVHYTQCRKPWNCVGTGVHGGAQGTAIDTDAGHYEKCMEIIERWHSYRSDLEHQWHQLTGDQQLLSFNTGGRPNYKPEIFHGHCHGEGGKNYSQITASQKSFYRLRDLYQPNA